MLFNIQATEPKVEETGEALLLKLQENDAKINQLLAQIENDEVSIFILLPLLSTEASFSCHCSVVLCLGLCPGVTFVV